MELDPIELSDERHRGDPRHAGPDGGPQRRLRAGRREARRAGRARSCARLESLRERGGLRRVAAILYHRRAGFSRQRHGRVGGAGRRDPGHRPPDGRVPRHQPLLPAPDLRGLAVLGLHDGPRPLEGGVRRGAGRDRRADRASSSARRCTRAPSSRRSGCSTSPTTSSAGKRSTGPEHLAPSRTPAPRSSTGARCTCCRAASTRRCGRCARSAATRSSSSARPAPSSPTSTATSTSTTCARGGR